MRSKWWVGLSVLILAVFLATSVFAITWPRYWKLDFTDWEYFNPDIENPYTDGPDGKEDNWGIARVLGIIDLSSPSQDVAWYDVTGDDKSLRVFFYGLDLAYWDTDFKYGMAALPSGAYLEIYEWDEDWDSSIVNVDNKSGNAFAGITDGGTLLARFEFTYGVTSDPNIVASGSTTDGANPPNGTGQAFLKVVDGIYKDVFDINRDELLSVVQIDGPTFEPDQVDPEADLFVTFHFNPPALGGFHLTSNDPAYGATIPEPASLMLVGTGLLAIGMLVRRKKMF